MKQNEKKISAIEVIPVWKFVLLSVLTLGLYPFIWTYRFWKHVRKVYGADVSPFWRSILHFMFATGLFRQVQQLARSRGDTADYSPLLFGLVYYMLFVSRFLGVPYAFAALLSFVPFIPVVQSWRYYLVHNEWDVVEHKAFTGSEMLLILMVWTVEIGLALLILQSGLPLK